MLHLKAFQLIANNNVSTQRIQYNFTFLKLMLNHQVHVSNCKETRKCIAFCDDVKYNVENDFNSYNV